MALIIDNPETERLVLELARQNGLTPEQTIAEAVEALSKQSSRPSRSNGERESADRAKIREIQRRVAALPTLDARSADEIIGYDEHGVPR